MIYNPIFYITILLCVNATVFASGKALICGVCRNIEAAVPNTISQIELLGEKFDDYAVIIYENNSADKTAELLYRWAATNPRVVFESEMLSERKLSDRREERIARARNIVLEIAKREEYDDFDYLIMVDLDFITPWPVDEIVATTQLSGEWDCISANGVFRNGTLYWDRYAFRDREYPFGPELLGSGWWKGLKNSWFGIDSDELKPVFSAFGGLAVYKRSTIIRFSYSGTATKELQKYYEMILGLLDPTNQDVLGYLKINKLKSFKEACEKPIVLRSRNPSGRRSEFKHIVCCEHVTLHAAMALEGYDKLFINPRLVMDYSH